MFLEALGVPAWTTDEDGCAIRRSELADEIVNEDASGWGEALAAIEELIDGNNTALA